MLKNLLRPAVVLTLLLCLITGFVYPGIVTAVAQLLFPRQANGSLVTGPRGQPIGSALIGQRFSRAEYFHPRPSAAGAGYDDTLSGGTNKGPTDAKLDDTLIARALDSAVTLDGAVKGQVPSDLVTSSASGLDPHISPAAAEYQIERISKARGIPEDRLRELVKKYTESRQLGVLGEARVNVLELNLALDSAAR